jgi:chromosome segregation ATPase
MLREDRERERSKSQSAVVSAITSHSMLESERDAALADVQDLKQQLAAATADLEVAKSDKSRIMTANNNLQAALEAFQDERQAEMELVDEQTREAEDAIVSAHAAAMDAARQAHEAEMKLVQNAADVAVKNVMDEVHTLERNVEMLRSENSQMRRSLDEAIHRLQSNQEDVIDRALMKNILLDWCAMKDKVKRHQVLQLMASVLHFTEEEKEKVHLTHMDIDSVRAKVVGALAAPLPPSKATFVEGSNVQEKWLSFLLAETDDGN